MVVFLTYLELLKYIFLFTYLWLETLAAPDIQELSADDTRHISLLTYKGHAETSALEMETAGIPHCNTAALRDTARDNIELAALGRPLSPGMLYDCRKDSFIPGVTLWDKKLLSGHLVTSPQEGTDWKFSESDSLSSKSSLMDISASLKASIAGGLANVEGSAKYLHDTKSSNQQSRVTMRYSRTTILKTLTMTQLCNITYPQVLDQKTATHVVTGVLYGAQAFMVFDRTFSENDNKTEIDGELKFMVNSIPTFYIDGKGSVNMTDSQKEMAKKITCTFHGDVLLNSPPTTFMEALATCKNISTLMNSQKAVPVKVWLYPLHKLDTKAAKLVREISTSLVSITEDIMEALDDAERAYNDLFKNNLVDVFSDLKERLQSFQESFGLYKSVLQKAVGRVLPAIRGNQEMKEKSLENILKIHYESPFNAKMLKEWLDDAKSELNLLSFHIKKLESIEITDSVGLNSILLDPDIDFVVCLTFTSLKYEDPYLSALQEFLKSDKFKELDGNTTLFSAASVRKWFNDPEVIIKMRDILSHFRAFSQANKDEKRIRFIVSAISNPSNKGSSIYLYEQGKLTSTQFQLVSKPPPPIVKDVLNQAVSLKLQKSPIRETVQFRVEFKQVKADSGADEQWLVINTADEDVTLTGLESGEQYLIRYRIVGKVGVSEASDTVTVHITPPSVQPVLVGKTEGAEFSLMTSSSSTFKKIILYYPHPQAGEIVLNVRSIQVFFNNGQIIKVGRSEGYKKHEFIFDNDDKIVAASLLQNPYYNYFCGLAFVVAKSDGSKTELSFKCSLVGQPVSVDVKSGKCYGLKARSTTIINALGFYFI